MNFHILHVTFSNVFTLGCFFPLWKDLRHIYLLSALQLKIIDAVTDLFSFAALHARSQWISFCWSLTWFAQISCRNRHILELTSPAYTRSGPKLWVTAPFTYLQHPATCRGNNCCFCHMPQCSAKPLWSVPPWANFIMRWLEAHGAAH